MSDIVKEMRNDLPEGFFGLEVFLAAYMTKAANNSGSAIKTVCFFP